MQRQLKDFTVGSEKSQNKSSSQGALRAQNRTSVQILLHIK